ncbi:hypothetical protein MMC13_002310 [Lambiella insularis]|nr:hypothetical protein [Lambiella insularis]
MSRIEELPDDYDDTAAISGDAFPVPSLPPHLASEPKLSVDELAADLKKSPFFMTSMDDVGDEENEQMEAIRALMYEGTRAENAEGFREQGNEMARVKKWPNAKEFYTKGLLALRAERKAEDATGEEEDKRERVVKEACLNVLSLAPANVKAHYRLASALLAIQKFPDALFACANGLTYHPDNVSLVAIHAKINSQMTVSDTAAKKRLKVETSRKKEADTLVAALKLRNIASRTTGQPPDLEDAFIRLVPDPLALATSTLTFPLVLLYPLHLQSDFIKAFGEEQSLLGHLGYLLPLPWDEKREYSSQGVEAYMETKEGGLMKWGKKLPLLKVLSGGKVEVVDGIVRANLLPKVRADEWIREVKKRKMKG